MVADVEKEETPFGQINLLFSLSPRLPIKTFLSIPGCFERKVFGTRKWKRETLAKKRLPPFLSSALEAASVPLFPPLDTEGGGWKGFIRGGKATSAEGEEEQKKGGGAKARHS